MIKFKKITIQDSHTFVFYFKTISKCLDVVIWMYSILSVLNNVFIDNDMFLFVMLVHIPVEFQPYLPAVNFV